MPQATTIKYQFAYNSGGQVVHIEELSRSSQVRPEIYKCIACEKILVPVLGKIRRKYFRHQPNTNCSRETYLHQLGKLIFQKVYQDCLQTDKPFTIQFWNNRICTRYEHDFRFTCERSPELEEHDLTRYFCSIRQETRDGSFIPDLLLESNNGQKIFIEIAVTHFSTDVKLVSMNRIIELAIKNEEDLLLIKNCFLSQTDDRVNFINFKTERRGNFCGDAGLCPVNNFKPWDSYQLKYKVFIILRNGKSRVILQTLEEFKNDVNLAHHKVIRNDTKIAYMQAIVKAYQNGLPIKNCYLCRYHSDNYSRGEGAIFCKYLKKGCDSNEAANCRSYRPDPKVFPIEVTN